MNQLKAKFIYVILRKYNPCLDNRFKFQPLDKQEEFTKT